MSPNLKNSRSMRLVIALVIPFVLFCFIYTLRPTSIFVLGPKELPYLPSETTLTGTGDSASVVPTTTAAPSYSYTLPHKVWHSAKSDNITRDQREWIGSWTRKNPSIRQELLTDLSAEAFVRARFYNTRPDIVEVYEGLQIAILRADLFRYLVVLAEGGIWGDLDVSCEKEVAEWVPYEYRNQTIDMIVGLEFDFEWRGPGTGVASQFCNWIFVARQSSRNLQIVVDFVIKKLKEIAQENAVGIEGVTLDMISDVVDVTGPKMMTVAILDSLGQLLGRTVDDRDFSGIKRPKLVGDVLIMPGVSFAALQNGNPTDQGDALVSHHYEGSWKKEADAARERKKQEELQRQQQQQPQVPPPAETELALQ
ncbi:CAZyme family GT32 [Penicillium bovifimosum]|uniref:CAZyme family GT32 n=1 Tax=Penicillium bovifimosum TaxID=126998 RepID=A0A9W9HBY8_9EURO|nr:CAZyme family GT32 [Penicillium bovifimosum]KAJ5143629.1 CAZyme family GT32 [Penicillium bovifimosum]